MSAVRKRTPTDPWELDLTAADDDSAWMAEHDAELFAKYRGQWVAVFRRQVVGTGRTAVEAAEQARRVAPPGAYILHAYDDIIDLPHVTA